jgi:hypothetical protein
MRLGGQLSLTKTTAQHGQQQYPYPAEWQGLADPLLDALPTLLAEEGWSLILNKLYR